MCSRPELRRYCIGGFVVEICSPPFTETERLRVFRTEVSQPPDRRLTLRLVPRVSVPEAALQQRFGINRWTDEQGRRCSCCAKSQGEGLLYRSCELSPSEVFVEYDEDELNGLSSHLMLRWLELPRVFLEREALFLHASFLDFKGKAILFTAPKQTGKSTQAALWERFGDAEAINGDRALLRCSGGVWRAYGSPFCGSSNLCKDRTLEIAAIVILRQGAQNVIARATPRQILLGFLEGASYDADNRSATEAVLDLAGRIGAQVPVYHLACLPEQSAVSCLYERLKEDGIYA